MDHFFKNDVMNRLTAGVEELGALREVLEGAEQARRSNQDLDDARLDMVRARELADGELVAVRGELARVDAKCGVLAGLAGAGLAFLVTQMGAPEPWPVRVLLAGAGIALATAAVVLLAGVIRPRLGRTGFVHWSNLTAEQARQSLLEVASLADDHRATELVNLSRIAACKNRRLRVAADLMVAGVVLTGIALVAGVIA